MTRALLLVDVQLDYFPGGAFPLVGPEAAARAGGAVLEHFRASGEDVVHVFHTATEPDAGFFVPGAPGTAFHPAVEPRAGEAVVEKHEPNSFIGTGLEQLLRDRGVSEVVVLGMMTSMCIDSTVRAASELGFTCTVVADACAAPDLSSGAVTVPGASVHTAFLAALDGSFATVVESADLVEH
ncbi:MAG: cysteine hydrolase family protein [Curtobacterium sp.]